MNKTYCDRCKSRIRNKDQFILLGYNGDLCEKCFEGLMLMLESSRNETIKLYMQPERSKREDDEYECPKPKRSYKIKVKIADVKKGVPLPIDAVL